MGIERAVRLHFNNFLQLKWMEQLISVISKKTDPKKKKGKSRHNCQLSIQTALTNNVSLHKPPPAHNSLPSKPPGPQRRPLKSSLLKEPSFTAKPGHPACFPSKKSSARRISKTKGQGNNFKKSKKGDITERGKTGSMNLPEKGDATKSIFPLSHERDLGCKSYLIASNGDRIEPEPEDGLSSLEQAAPDLPFDSGQRERVAEGIKQFYEGNTAMERAAVSRREWEAYQTLKMKNEELTNYIQELEKIQEKSQQQEERKQTALRSRYDQERIQLLAQITDLKEEQNRLNRTNATLQELFNEGKQNLDIMTQRCQELASTQRNPIGQPSPTLPRGQSPPTVDHPQRRIQELQSEVSLSRSSIQALVRDKMASQRQMLAVKAQKVQIKLRAEQMLNMLLLIKESSM